ncbi:MAG: GTPase HflX [Paracoccaceae bacterium]
MRSLVLHPELTGLPDRRDPSHALREALGLTAALGVEIADSEIIGLPRPRAGTYFGTGKVAQLAERVRELDVGLVVINASITPVQQRNLETRWNAKVLDRVGLILEIFGDRASTREGVLQVALAHLTYQKSRLVRSWTHLERQRGALGFVGGPGETQIESDRRAISQQILRIRKQLRKVVNTRRLHRQARDRVPFPTVALVGYTNAGKSTLFNRLTGASVDARDMLFATLDPTMRAVELAHGEKIILSDTVGFISDLPTQLVAAFRATLEEVLNADIILHVRDISHEQSEEQAEDVREILRELGIGDQRQGDIYEVWNKIDLVAPDILPTVRNRANRSDRVFPVSSLTGAGFSDLTTGLRNALADTKQTETIRVGFDDGRRRAWLYEHKVVTGETATDGGLAIDVSWSKRQRALFQHLSSKVA